MAHLIDGTWYRLLRLVELPPASVALSVASFGSNLYVGLQSGELLHFHKFDDAPDYLLISQLSFEGPIAKLLVLEEIDRLVVLGGTTAHVHSLPELSTCRIDKIEDVNDVTILQAVRKQDKPTKVPVKDAKVVFYGSTKIRLLLLTGDAYKVLKDIPYTHAIHGVSCILGTSTNYSNLTLVANKSNYEIVDLQQTRKISLFEYTSGDTVPHIVPFSTTEKEEYLLTVQSDEKTSIGMFIDSLGDVTRGTISWDVGYPSGLAVCGDHVIGSFGDKLVFTSLTSQQVLLSEELSQWDIDETFLVLLSEAVPFIDQLLHEIVGQHPMASSSVVIQTPLALYVLHEEDRLVRLVDKVTQAFKGGDVKGILSSVGDTAFEKALRPLLQLQAGDVVVDDLAADQMWVLLACYEPVAVESYPGIKRLIPLIKPKAELHEPLLKKLYPVHPELRKLVYTVTGLDRLVATVDTDDWSGPSTEIIDVLRERQAYAALLNAFDKQKAAADERCRLVLELLRGDIHDPAYHMENGIINGVELVHLGYSLIKDIEDEDVYTELLLEFLKVAPDAGLAYLKKNKSSHKKAHSLILQGIDSGEVDFSSLKIEYLEQSFGENTSDPLLLNQLLGELISTLKAFDNTHRTNFSILQKTYQVENMLTDSHWPKPLWCDFLRTHGVRSECKHLVEVYLKVFELLLGRVLLGNSEAIEVDELFSYLRQVHSPRYQDLLEVHDWTSAEFVVVHGHLPFPSQPYYFKDMRSHYKTVQEPKQQLFELFGACLATTDTRGSILYTQHFVATYQQHISLVEMLALVPDYVPMAYLKDVLVKILVELDANVREGVLRKTLQRADAKHNASIYNDLKGES